MDKEWLYPLGFLATALFSLRFLVQWLLSEKKKESHVTPLFWQLSLAAHTIFALHGFIQLQYPILLIQMINGAIAWRNLSLHKRALRPFLLYAALLVACMTTLFALYAQGSTSWMLPSKLPWEDKSAPHPSWAWHFLGILGITIFATRFWIQWWANERSKKSTLSPSFWYLSIVGSLLSLAYFLRMHDLVNILGAAVPLLPYLRNLKLTKQESHRLDDGLIFMIAGEQSGDLLGAELMAALQKKNPSLRFAGMGGPLMRACGLRCIVEMEKLQTMGFFNVIKRLVPILRYMYLIKREILTQSPATVIFIDCPDFNMRLSKLLRRKKCSAKLVHYVSPSIWAWRKGRSKKLAHSLDLLLSILPFEKEHYAATTLPVSYVGHPLLELLSRYTYKPYAPLNHTPLLSLFPGSRPAAIRTNLPLQLASAALFLKDHPHFSLAISVARDDLKELITQLLAQTRLSALLIPPTMRYELMQASTLSLATCGTVTLELALHATPTVVTYTLPPLYYSLGRHLFNIRLTHFSLPNILLKSPLFPECIGPHARPPIISAALSSLLPQTPLIQAQCHTLWTLLSPHNASEQAASAILCTK